ncbi:peptidoglycan-associated lipoprotein Pal [Ramlibacter ginsenosidimutans]|uniref:Peptidoglycan-associated protein n=1 Tax=Ramlibacter ginsenosidimutans TaxID=502333 RepID=A0A934TTD1_9BURK|nr:peptidoglycan-associated lipoprotein Pal [Ramlibacter ginsenosidimutans]
MILITASLGLAACSTPPKPAPVTSAPGVAAASPAASVAQPAAAAPGTLRPEYLDPSSAIAKRRSVYFGFDDNAIRQQDRDVIELQGRYLASHPGVSVRVEGNTDERGSAEYNLALGQRRADATAKALEVFGARSSQLDATSWGAEKPVAAGHDEAAWAQNRRADVVYPSK